MKNKSFAQDVITLTTAPLISQIVGLLLTPIVTRMYGPEMYGLYNIFGSVVILVAVLATMGYHGAIILPKEDETAQDILLVCTISVLAVSVLSFILVLTCNEMIANRLNAPELSKYLWLMPFFVFSHGMYQTLRYWKTRLRRFDNLAISRVSEILMRKTVQIPAGILGFASTGSLLFADVLANVIKNIILLKNVRLKRGYLKSKYFSRIWIVAKRYRKFPKYSVWAELASRLPSVILSIFILKYFGQDILGYYGLSLMVLSLPSALISVSISEAFIPRAAMAKHDNKHSELLEKLYFRLVSIMVLPFIMLGLFSRNLFPFVFGQEWMQAGVITQILIFRIFFEIIFSPALSLVDIMEKQEFHIIQKIISVIIALVSLMLGIYYNDIYLTFWCLALMEGASISIMGGYMMHLIDFPFLYSIKKISINVILAIFLGLSLFICSNILSVGNYFLLGSIIAIHIIYYFVLAYFDREIVNSLRTLLHL